MSPRSTPESTRSASAPMHRHSALAWRARRSRKAASAAKWGPRSWSSGSRRSHRIVAHCNAAARAGLLHPPRRPIVTNPGSVGRAVEADGSHATFTRYYSEYVRPVDLYKPEGADEILTLAMEIDRRVLVDLPAQSHRSLSAWIDEGGVFEVAREAGVKMVFWHVIDDGKDSIATLGRLLERYGAAASYCVVKNLGRGKD